MDAFQAWLSDKRNLPIIAGVAAVIVVGGVILLLLSNRSSAPQLPSNAAGNPVATATAPAAVPGAAGLPAPTASGGLAGPGATPTPATTKGAASTAPTSPAKPDGAMLPYRKDPFAPFGGPVTKTQVLQSLLPGVVHTVLPAPVVSPQAKKPELPEVLPAQPFRRMAGVLIDGKISAILETNHESDIVTPGMEISKGGSRVRVEGITSDTITLKTLDTRKPFTIEVNLSGSIALPAATPVATAGITPVAGVRASGRPANRLEERDK